MMQKDSITVCETCGNALAESERFCPFCGTKRQVRHRPVGQPEYRTVNLEKNMPLVQDALLRMQTEIATAGIHGVQVLILIHGYGSSGKGGAIRKEVRKQLRFLREQKKIHDFLPGELCEKKTGNFRHLIRRFPFLERQLKKKNPGITVVVI